MINKISFAGRVIWANNVRNLSLDSEVNAIREYTMKHDCDVVVCDRDYYMDDTGKYHCIVLKEDPTTGKNLTKMKIFDFKHPENDKEKELDFTI